MKRIFLTTTLTFIVLMFVGSAAASTAFAAEDDDGQDKQSDLGKIETRLQVPIPQLTDPTGKITITSRSLAEYIIRIYNFLLFAAVVLAVVMLVWGGFMWMTAGGGSERIGKAQGYIGNAIAGLVILFGAYLILSIVNPELTTLKSLKLQQIKPMATGFFCDTRIDSLNTIYKKDFKKDPPSLFLVPVQTKYEETARNPSDVQDDEFINASDIQKVKEKAECTTAYVIKQTFRDPKTNKEETGFERSACFGRSCIRAAESVARLTNAPFFPFICNSNKDGVGQPGCVRGTFGGSIHFTNGRGVDYIKIFKKVQGSGDDEKVFSLNTAPDSDGYAITATEKDLDAIDDNANYYMQIELEEGLWESDDIYYIGKTGQRIAFDSYDTRCGVVTNASPRKVDWEDSCDELFWKGSEIKKGISMDLNVTDQEIFEEDNGE